MMAEVQVTSPGNHHVLKRKDIPSAGSYTFTLGPVRLDLVVFYEGKSALFLYELSFLRLYMLLTLALALMVENKWNMYLSFSICR